MKTKHLFFLLCLLALGSAQAQIVKQHGALQVKGTQLTNAKGEPVMLRGMSFGWHCFWPRFYNAGAVNWLVKDWKVNVVRAAMGVEPKDGYLQ